MVEDDPSPTQLNRFCSQKVTILCKKTLASKYLQLRIAAVKKASPQNHSSSRETFVHGLVGTGRLPENIVATLSLVALLVGAPLEQERTQLAVQLL